jgi:roadblock/LC7 domain-containing protein
MASYTLAQLQALEAAIASGALRVTNDGQTVEYRSIAEMMRIAATIRLELGLTPQSVDNGRRYARFDGGF